MSEQESAPDREDDLGAIRDRETAVLLGTLVHDIRTPLSAMSGWLEVLEAQLGESSARYERALNGLRRGIASQTQVVNTMAETLARHETGGTVEPERRRFAPLLDRALRALTSAAVADDAASRRLADLQVLVGGAEASTLRCADSGESLAVACGVLLRALASVRGEGDPPFGIEADAARIRLRAPSARGDRSAIRGLCAGLQRPGAGRGPIAPQVLWLSRATFDRSGIALALDDRPDGLVVTLSSRPAPESRAR